MPNIGGDLGRGNLEHCCQENRRTWAFCRVQLAFLIELSKYTLHDSAFLSLAMQSKEILTQLPKGHAYTRFFTAALVEVPGSWRPPGCRSSVDWIGKCGGCAQWSMVQQFRNHRLVVAIAT